MHFVEMLLAVVTEIIYDFGCLCGDKFALLFLAVKDTERILVKT